MDPHDAQAHWDRIYRTKQPHEVSWTQDVPATSLAFVHSFNLPKSANIIDIGGGDSKLVDFLLYEGYEHITVLDISADALERAKERLGAKADRVHWVTSDITKFEPETTYDLWHDRAVFHFLTDPADVEKYLHRVSSMLRPGGLMILATFSENGPEKCSGIPVKRYSEREMLESLQRICDRIKCFTVDHATPFNTVQNFLFCAFRKKA